MAAVHQKRQEVGSWSRSMTAMLQGSLVGAAGALVLLGVTALLCFLGAIPVALGEYTAPAAALVGAFVGGGYTMKKLGMRAVGLTGISVGGVLFLVLLSAGLLIYRTEPDAARSGVILACCLCGGGLAGLLLRRAGKKRRR